MSSSSIVFGTSFLSTGNCLVILDLLGLGVLGIQVCFRSSVQGVGDVHSPAMSLRLDEERLSLTEY